MDAGGYDKRCVINWPSGSGYEDNKNFKKRTIHYFKIFNDLLPISKHIFPQNVQAGSG
jgi:hypothetical protein